MVDNVIADPKGGIANDLIPPEIAGGCNSGEVPRTGIQYAWGIGLRLCRDMGLRLCRLRDDVHFRYIAGCRVSRTAHATVALDALEQAIHERRPVHRGGLFHHRDRRSQYFSDTWSVWGSMAIL
jgi:hypothetical protein